MLRRPHIIAHRGASGYEYENSRAAFRRAIALDADGVELDVHATRDGDIVVHHDPELRDAGPIALLSTAEVVAARLTNGEPIPLLAEVLELLDGRSAWVEVKALSPHHDEALIAALSGGPDPERYAIHSFDHRIVHRLGAGAPWLRRGVLLTAYVVDPVAVLRAAGATTLWQAWEQIDEELVAQVHAADCELIAWTVNEMGDLERLARMGVDGLCGNYPDRIRIATGPRPAPG
ncbi:MAG TPA: glycerophosphodiester phosphodiesterase [Gemmatimonadales bacterium]|nr:glycerophosphodiester phosphodiesterase [Gemmatimonadales bacterium]